MMWTFARQKRERVPIYLILDLIVADTVFALVFKYWPSSRRASAIFVSEETANAL